MWFDIFGTESLTLPGPGWLLLHGNRVCLFSEPLSRITVFRVRQAGQAATCDQARPPEVHTQPSQSKQKLRLCSAAAASVKIPANNIVTTASRYHHTIKELPTVCLVMLDLASKGVKLTHNSASVRYLLPTCVCCPGLAGCCLNSVAMHWPGCGKVTPVCVLQPASC